VQGIPTLAGHVGLLLLQPSWRHREHFLGARWVSIFLIYCFLLVYFDAFDYFLNLLKKCSIFFNF
jgi:hypothetical protein